MVVPPMAACSSRCCSIPAAPTPQPSFGRPSSFIAPAILSSLKPVPTVIYVAAGPRWRCEPLPGTPHRHGIRSCAGSPVTGGEPSPHLRNRIFIKGLPSSTSEGTLVKTFSQFGDVSRVKIITSKISKQSLGFAYVWFASEEDADLAVKEMDGKFVDGRFIYVTIAKPESPTRQVRATPCRF